MTIINRKSAEIERLKIEMRRKQEELEELENAPTDMAGAAELAEKNPDKFNRLFDLGVLNDAFSSHLEPPPKRYR